MLNVLIMIVDNEFKRKIFWYEYCNLFCLPFHLQAKIIQELTSNGVQIYQFPIDDESIAEVNTGMNTHVPFAVVGSTEFIRIGNKTVRARQYPWGTVQGKTNVLQFIHCI